MATIDLENKLRDYLKKNVSRKRFDHILRVYSLSEILYRHQQKINESETSTSDNFFQNQSVNKLHMASLIHDATKEQTRDFHLEILQSTIENEGLIEYEGEKVAELDTKILTADLNQSGPVLHSKTAALFVATKFGYFDATVYDLVRFHTTGCDNPTQLMNIFFAADFLGSIYLYKKYGNTYSKRVKKRITQDSVNSLILDKQVGNIQSFLKHHKPIPLEILKRYHQYLPAND